MQLTILGCAGGVPTPDNANSAFLLQAAGTTVLIDFGHGAMRTLREHVEPSELDAVVLTHLHADHCADVASLLVYRRYHPQWRDDPDRRPVLPVYAPADAPDRLSHAYAPSAAARHAEDLSDVFAFRPLSDREPFAIGDLSVIPVRVDHSVETYGLRVHDRSSASVFAFTSDTGPCPSLKPLASGADLLLSEANWEFSPDRPKSTHLSGREAGDLATDAAVRRLVLTHVPCWRDADAILAEARATYDGPVELARQGAEYDLVATGPRVSGASR